MKTPAAIRCIAVAVTATLILAALANAQEAAIQAIRIQEPGPLLDPEAAFWSTAPAITVPMLAQTITTPKNPNAAIHALQVRAAHNGQWLGVQIEWQDSAKNDRIVVDQFGDQVAVEFPYEYKKDALPSPMMGNPGGRVEIWQWRAAFQRDIDEGEIRSIGDLYPNAVVDIYPDQVLRVTDARPYTGALGVDNPISHGRRSAVLEQMAEGWGTLTAEPFDQQTEGRGVWKDGVWRVVITHPLTSLRNDIHFQPGMETVAAFAVWDGGNREVGARKAWSMWVPFRLAE
ncbi:MAG: ethylbenzene dehydrogenase-related protein [Gammaproteobacteria bacterium]